MWLKKKTKVVAVVLALILAILTVIPVLAYQGIGNSPYAADLLVSGLNTGRLDPGQEYWYAYSQIDLGEGAYGSIILSLNFEADGVSVANRVNFQVFTFDQVEAWLKDNSGPIDSMGLGASASADFDAGTGERMWAGMVDPQEVYYVRIFNLSPSPVQFRLTALGQNEGTVNHLPANTFSPPVAQVIPAAASVPGAVPGSISANETVGVGAVPTQPTPTESPASTSWLLAAQAIHDLPPQEAAAWLMSAAMLGWLPDSEGAATSPAAVPIDPKTIAEPVVDEVGPETEVLDVTALDVMAEKEIEELILTTVPDPTTGESIYPNQPVALLYGPNTGVLAPKSEHWYEFTPGKLDGKLIENFSTTMFFTPGEPNLARHVTFELFDGGQYHIWERGTPQDMAHFGAGSWVSRDNDYMTGERLWHGTVVDGNKYFIKITNGTSKWIDYHLVPDDIINTELGKPTVKKIDPAPAIPTGKDIGAPLVTNKNRMQGQLAGGEDIWFNFTTPNTNPDSFDFLSYLVELTHTPGYGNVANYVNVELYPYQQQHLWRRGDGDKIVPLGAGSFTEYDEPTDSHTWIWDGHLVSNTTYFVRVRNDSPLDIDYDLSLQRR